VQLCFTPQSDAGNAAAAAAAAEDGLETPAADGVASAAQAKAAGGSGSSSCGSSLSSAAVMMGSGLTDADKAALKQLAAAVGEFSCIDCLHRMDCCLLAADSRLRFGGLFTDC
jgi:hypothetical protein